MLAGRPMLCFAVAAMTGAILARLFPGTDEWFSAGWLAAAVLVGWFVLTPGGRDSAETGAALPEGYARHVLPLPGFFARRGLNRLMIVAGWLFLMAGAERQTAWRKSVDMELSRLPGREWFSASFIALEPSHIRPGTENARRVRARLIEGGGIKNLNLTVQLQAPADERFRRGDLVLAWVRREQSRMQPYPGAFDPPLWLENNGVFARLAVPLVGKDGKKPYFRVINLEESTLSTWVRRLVDDLRSLAVDRTLELAGDQGSLLSAMLYGYREDLDRDLRDAFRRVGIGHVLAISGLHVGLLTGLLWWLGGWLSLSRRARSGGCLVLSFLYLGLAGGQVAAARATVMLGIHFLGGIAGRRSDMLNSLGAAALLLVFINPSAPFDVSFQLSFTAMVFIHASIRREPEGGRRPQESARSGEANSRVRRVLAEIPPLARISFATWLGLFPIVASVFNQVNLIGLAINIVVIPLMTLVLAGGLLLPWLGWLPGCAWLLCLPSRALAGLTLAADRLPYASFSCHAPALPALAVFYLSAIVFLLGGLARDRTRQRRWRNVSMAGVGLAFLVVLVSMASEPPPAGGRTTILPGRGFGSLVAESAGGAAVIGEWDRGGEDEADWLHSQRRGGGVGVLSLTRPGKDNLSALAYHYPLTAVTFLPKENRKEANLRKDWLPVPGAPGVEYAFRRDQNGKLVWLAARAGENSVCLTPYLTVNRLKTFRRDAREMKFRLLRLAFYGSGWKNLSPPDFPCLVAANAGSVPPDRPNWFNRGAYGALRLSGELVGFAGGRWEKIGD